MSFAPAYPHGSIEKIAENVFMVRGSIMLNPITRICRNMAIVKEGDTLTLINPIRLNSEGLEALEAQGTVKHILRLGAFHGLDDPFYMDRYKPQFWSQEGGETYPEPKPAHVLSDGCPLPFDGGEIHCFHGTKEPECVLLMKEQRLLLTCDAIQHYGDYSYNNFLARLLMPFIGFPKRTLIGPIWLKHMSEDAASLRPQFEQIADLDFDSLFSAHGTFLQSGAQENVRKAIELAFEK